MKGLKFFGKLLLGLMLLIMVGAMLAAWPLPVALVTAVISFEYLRRAGIIAVTTGRNITATTIHVAGRTVNLMALAVAWVVVFIVLQWAISWMFGFSPGGFWQRFRGGNAIGSFWDLGWMAKLYASQTIAVLLAALLAMLLVTPRLRRGWLGCLIALCLLILVYPSVMAQHPAWQSWLWENVGLPHAPPPDVLVAGAGDTQPALAIVPMDERVVASIACKRDSQNHLQVSQNLHAAARNGAQAALVGNFAAIQQQVTITIPEGEPVILYGDTTGINEVETAQPKSTYVVTLASDKILRNVDTNLIYVVAINSQRPTQVGYLRLDLIASELIPACKARGIDISGLEVWMPKRTVRESVPASQPMVRYTAASGTVVASSEVTVAINGWVSATMVSNDRETITVEPVSGALEDAARLMIRSGSASPAQVIPVRGDDDRYYGEIITYGVNRTGEPILLKLSHGSPVHVIVRKIVKERLKQSA